MASEGKTPRKTKQTVTNAKGLTSDVLIVQGGRTGVFLPLPESVPEAETLAADAVRLKAVLASLRSEVERLTRENAEMKTTLAAQAQSGQTADDIATAIQHTVDTLQSRLSSLRNSVSDFAVKEFRLESNVRVDIDPLGQAVYKFVKPGEQVGDYELSKLALALVPLPKQSTAGSFTRTVFSPDRDLEEIDGIGASFRRKLNQSNLFTVGDLLQAATRVRTKVELASMLDVDRAKLEAWLSQAELMTIKDIDGKTGRVLNLAGIAGLEQLAKAEPAPLAKLLAEIAAKNKIKGFQVTEERVLMWIQAATAFVTGGKLGTTEGST